MHQNVIHGPYVSLKFNVSLENNDYFVVVYDSTKNQYLFLHADQLNTCVHSTMKATPYELVFGQPPQYSFPGCIWIIDGGRRGRHLARRRCVHN